MKSKFLAVSVVASMLFTGCSKNGIYGTYSFQMGKDNGFHLKAQMVLSNEDYVRESGEVDGKKFSFTIDIGTTEKALPKNLYRSDESDDVTDEEDNEDVYSDDDFDFLSLLPNPFTLDGHFKLGGLSPNDRTILDLSFTIFDDFADLFSEIGFSGNPNSIINYLVFTEMEKTNIYFTLPVSMDDIIFQLYWYGFDINNDDTSKMECTAHDFGTIPTSEDIAEINKTYPNEHSGTKYRIFHTLELGLIKD